MGVAGAIGFSAAMETAGIMFLEPLATVWVTAVEEDRATKLNILIGEKALNRWKPIFTRKTENTGARWIPIVCNLGWGWVTALPYRPHYSHARSRHKSHKVTQNLIKL